MSSRQRGRGSSQLGTGQSKHSTNKSHKDGGEVSIDINGELMVPGSHRNISISTIDADGNPVPKKRVVKKVSMMSADCDKVTVSDNKVA